MTKQRLVPEITGRLRSNIVRVPQALHACSGIIILGKRIKSLIFTTDVAIIRNHNADAVLAVYPFTPQPMISSALILAADVPIFCGVGGGTTSGRRALEIAMDAEFQGALGVVLNQPVPNRLVERIRSKLEIPVLVTIARRGEDIRGRLSAGVDVLNVSGAEHTAEIVREIREISDTVPVIATGGRTPNHVNAVVEAGANAVTYTPPTTAELFRTLMIRYRKVDVREDEGEGHGPVAGTRE